MRFASKCRICSLALLTNIGDIRWKWMGRNNDQNIKTMKKVCIPLILFQFRTISSSTGIDKIEFFQLDFLDLARIKFFPPLRIVEVIPKFHFFQELEI